MSLHPASQAIKEWVLSFHAELDGFSTTNLEKLCTDDASMSLGNNPLLVGIEAITAYFASVFPLLSSMKHETISLDVIGNKVCQFGYIEYVVKDDPQNRTIKIPAMGVFHFVPEADFESGEPLLKHFDEFLDSSEVSEIIGEVQKLKSEGAL
ncbi:hypothetical protein VTL71DRAFT_15889 [Oculimacula yallundae]|uniref:SnoaL-like domain-containing protein n=1 Tax=Oculimacula yallundae TaxID=86028 RepID=A0ABR4CFB5_9HELO